MNNLESIEIQSARAMIEVPENCVELTMNCTVYLDGKLQVVQRTLSMKEIQTAIQKAEDGYIDEDDRFFLTEKGEDWLNWREELGDME